MKLKTLIRKFSYDELVKTCEKEGWKIPSSKDVEDKVLEHETFWISDLPKKQDRTTHAHIFNQRWQHSLQIANKHFLMNAVVIVEEKFCEWNGDNEFGIFSTSCGNNFEVIEGTPFDNSFKYCPYCGHIIKENK